MQNTNLTQSSFGISVYSEDDALVAIWSKAFEAWITNYKSASTAQSYRDGWRFFLQFSQLPPWKVGRSHVVDYITDMRGKNLSDATIHLRLSALSSFFDFVCRDYTIIKDGREVPLYDLNPASSKQLRKRVNPYQKANYLRRDEIKTFLDAIDQTTLQGMRDYALFLGYFLTGRRNSELRRLTWGDMTIEDGGYVTYTWSGKNVIRQRAEMPHPAYQAIITYLRATGRLETIQPGDYVFVGFDQATGKPQSWPIGSRETRKLLKKYCRLANINKPICCHSLRHSATMMRRSAGETMEEVSKFLSHSSFATTQTYLHSLEGYRDRAWKKVGKLLNL